MINPKTGMVLGTGKVTAIDGPAAAQRLAIDIVNQIRRVRPVPATPWIHLDEKRATRTGVCTAARDSVYARWHTGKARLYFALSGVWQRHQFSRRDRSVCLRSKQWPVPCGLGNPLWWKRGCQLSSRGYTRWTCQSCPQCPYVFAWKHRVAITKPACSRVRLWLEHSLRCRKLMAYHEFLY